MPTSTVVLLDSSALAAAQDRSLIPLGPACRDVLHVVGAFNTRLVFLDKDLCICSVERLSRRVRRDERFQEEKGLRYVKHFFIPSDWYSQSRDLETRVTGKGDAVFVRAEEVAVVKHGLSEGDKH